jgi:hypothetical protein
MAEVRRQSYHLSAAEDEVLVTHQFVDQYGMYKTIPACLSLMKCTARVDSVGNDVLTAFASVQDDLPGGGLSFHLARKASVLKIAAAFFSG